MVEAKTDETILLEDIFMTYRTDDVQIDRVHSGAICKQIGGTLRVTLAEEGEQLPPRLSLLLERLARIEARQRALKLAAAPR